MSRVEVDRACPVVLRESGGLEVLAFEHPLAGLQVVKGRLEPGESSQAAAIRELFEEAGIRAKAVRDFGLFFNPSAQQVWAFHQCEPCLALPDAWTHRTEDDGGHVFRFFWHPLADEPGETWHPLFRDALAFVRSQLLGSTTGEARR
ncbi:NUDIX hydrolase [Metapseudomonas otitidis]|uniref:NUDIX hydrolase n=1 Tax=Metapseudomonas otitidis TaxID=319939 RepID=UPI003EE133F6